MLRRLIILPIIIAIFIGIVYIWRFYIILLFIQLCQLLEFIYFLFLRGVLQRSVEYMSVASLIIIIRAIIENFIYYYHYYLLRLNAFPYKMDTKVFIRRRKITTQFECIGDQKVKSRLNDLKYRYYRNVFIKEKCDRDIEFIFVYFSRKRKPSSFWFFIPVRSITENKTRVRTLKEMSIKLLLLEKQKL